MGTTIICKICQKEYSIKQITVHELQCERSRIGNNKTKSCEKISEYYDHVLSHYKCEDFKENEVNPSVTFCDYNFSIKKIQRLTKM